jgi:hypothetical protein
VEAAVNIREVIKKLQQVAEQLPDGLDSEVRVHICNGQQPGLMTPSIEVDTTQNQKTLAVRGDFAIVQGHPHRDEGSGNTAPMISEIDDLVEKWASEQQGAQGRSTSPSLIRVKTDHEDYMLLPLTDGKYAKLAFAGGRPLLPGHPNAVKAGCICDPVRNNHGWGRRHESGVQVVIKDGCPVHPKITGPVDPDSE